MMFLLMRSIHINKLRTKLKLKFHSRHFSRHSLAVIFSSKFKFKNSLELNICFLYELKWTQNPVLRICVLLQLQIIYQIYIWIMGISFWTNYLSIKRGNCFRYWLKINLRIQSSYESSQSTEPTSKSLWNLKTPWMLLT